MSRLRLTKIVQPANPPANTTEDYYDTTLGKRCIVDASGNVLVLGGFATKDYRFIRTTNIFAGTVTYTPTAGIKGLYVECIGAGGAGGGCASLAVASGAGGAGGGGAYSAAFLTGAAIKASYTVAVGAGGTAGAAGNTAGNAGGDTSFDTGPSVCTAKGGAGGAGDPGHTAITEAGTPGAGGASASGLGDLKTDGNIGGISLTLTALLAFSGEGAPGPIGGGAGAPKTTQGAGNAALSYGAGGSGGVMLNAGAAVAGGAGGNGFLRIWEFA